MSTELLHELLARNDEHRTELSSDAFDGVRDGQSPAVVSICCSDSRVSQEGMWAVDEPGWLFTPSYIGNRAWTVDDERNVAGGVAYPIVYAGTRTAAVVGHTACGAITAAYDAVFESGLPDDMPAGVRRDVEALIPVVEAARDEDVVDEERDREEAVNRLVEYNVHEQVSFLRSAPELPDDLDVYGFVYDFHGAYGDADGTTYLVNADGDRNRERLRELAGEYDSHVATLLE